MSFTEEHSLRENTYKVYGYRWVVLLVFMFINLLIQVLWISYAPITGPAASYYGVSDLQIGLLAMSFMIAYIPLSLPVSWVIDTYGFRLAVSIGAVPIRLESVTSPTAVARSSGENQRAGTFVQASVIFVYVMEALKGPNGAFTPSLLLAIGLLLACALVITRLDEPRFEGN